ncbi:MAG: dual specificity protein phosphatase family protein [Cytophagales bacterium]|nr:dual specificity protein phosphatase family protein [Cytophagales bacterium]
MIDLIIASRALASKILHNPNRHVDFLVSIGCPDRTPPSGYYTIPPERKLKLTFVDYMDDNDDPYPPTTDDVQNIINFVRYTIQPACQQPPVVLVHCEAGISRSAAVSQIILEELGFTKEEALDKILTVRPQARPNKYLLDIYYGKM